MKQIVLVLLGICATACVDGLSSHDRLELRLASGMTARLAKSGPEKVRIATMGRTIRYEQGALYVDDERLILPADARVVTFDETGIYVDGRSIEPR